MTETRMFDGIAKKGEIWNVIQGDSKPTGSEIWANRPAIVVSNNATNLNADFVNVVYLTTAQKKPMPYHVNVISGDKNAIALCEQIVAVDKSRLTFYVGTITDKEMLDVDKALLFSLGISNSLRPNSLFEKWLNCIDRYNVDMSGNPADSDNKTKEQLQAEVQKWKDLYTREHATINDLISLQA